MHTREEEDGLTRNVGEDGLAQFLLQAGVHTSQKGLPSLGHSPQIGGKHAAANGACLRRGVLRSASNGSLHQV